MICEIPQPFDYVGRGFHLDCYECHSNRPGCGPEIDWILSRWKHCDMPAPKCIKIIERLEGKLNVIRIKIRAIFNKLIYLKGRTFYVRGCLKQIEVAREDIPTVRENGCWTIDGEYVGWGRNLFVPTDKTIYCFCDERDGCNSANIKKSTMIFVSIFAICINVLSKYF